MSNEKIQKRLITFEIITRGEKPVDPTPIEQDALIAGFHRIVSSTIDLRYKNVNGDNRQHDFVGVDIREIK